MMNNARINVGLSGLAIAERAYQQARDFARDRIQGKAADGAPIAIIRYPDVRRMLLTMKASVEAMRALTFEAAATLDQSKRSDQAETRAQAQSRLDLLTPVVKAWCTDLGVEIASLGIQVHGGMGFIEETGAAQHLRDSRIGPIYEGTNGIQAADLVVRKVLRDGGAAAKSYIAELHALDGLLATSGDEDVAAIRRHLAAAAQALETATDWLLASTQIDHALAGATPYLRLFGTVAGGAMMARSALAAQAALGNGSDDHDFYRAKLTTARFYAENILPLAGALVAPICEGHGALLAFAEDQF
jgi:hypothetical protein